MAPSTPLTVLTLIGTRPEAIKLAPVILALRRKPARFHVRVCLTGQHRELVQQVLPAFGITADENLDTMTASQTLCGSTAKILSGLEGTFARHNPDLILVQGDTSTAFCGALAAFYSRIPVAHIEAGLRTHNPHNPFPEEMNRVLVTRLASFHFAPTDRAANNLYAEGIPEDRVWVTGNTGIDAVRLLSDRLEQGTIQPDFPCPIDPTRKLILVTAHRRENIPHGLKNIAESIAALAKRTDVQIVFPLHPNPEVRALVEPVLAKCNRVHLTGPLEYTLFVHLMSRACLLLSDSGGIQEEAPALGKPVLVLRDTTERPEAVQAGSTQLVGTDPQRIIQAATHLLDDASAYAAMAEPRNVYGDAKASSRICSTLSQLFKREYPSNLQAIAG